MAGFFYLRNYLSHDWLAPMPDVFSVQRRVEFRDTDAAGIVHFSNFFVYMEQAEHAFLRACGLGVVSEFNSQHLSWPRVSANCVYKQAIRFEDLVDIQLVVERIGEKSVTYGFQFFRQSSLIAEGSVTAVCCLFEPNQNLRSVAIPGEFSDAIKPYLVPPR